ncbi:MAG TPA: tetratricopeptide repeat protein [Candidatus Omnitrophota bacterium]|nr:tetratricopeptide repeat protein [Candidatus Omnitrophota bacterium]
MSEWFYKKLSFFMGLIVIFLLLGLVMFEANVEIKDFDIWLHLASGRYIIDHFSVPQADVLSCSISGKPWINHSWLFQVLLAESYRAAGFEGLINLQVAIVLLIFILLIFLGLRTGHQLLPLSFLILVLLTFETRLTLRPDIFSFLFLVFYIFILSNGLNHWRTLLILFFVQVLWVNIHGFFILGPFMILIGIIAEWIRRHIRLPYEWNNIGKLNDDEYLFFKIAFAVVVGACFINPYGLRGVLYPLNILSSLSGESKIFFSHISELAKPITFQTVFSLEPYWYFRAAIFVSFLGFIIHRKKIDISILLLWGIFLVLGLSALRNMVFFVLFAYVTFLFHLDILSPIKFLEEREKLKYVLAIILKIFLVAWIINYIGALSVRGYFDFDTLERKSEFGGVSKRLFPYKAVDFLVENKIKGNFYNQFNSGAYLLGRTYPDIKVFIDGRTEVYGPRFFKKSQDILYGDYKYFENTVKKYNITGVFLNWMSDRVPEKLLKNLYADKSWVLVYFDYDGAVFLKDIIENQKWILRHRVDLDRFVVPKLDMLKVGITPVIPFQYLNRANAFLALGFLEQARLEAQQALRIDPRITESYKLLGSIAAKQKNYDDAFCYYRQAKLLSPHDLEIRYYLAQGFYYLEDLDNAQKQCEKIVAAEPQNAKTFYFLVLVLIKQEKYEEALKALKKADKLSPYFSEELKDVEDILKTKNLFGPLKEMNEIIEKKKKVRRSK